MLKRVTVVFALLAMLVVGAVPAYAVTDGALDGNGHPYVGIMVAKNAAGAPLWRCSGTLIAPTVFLTAGHCTEAPAASAEIWFKSDMQTNSNRFTSPGVPNPDWNGYPFNGEVSGTTHTHPDYDPNAFYVRDLGIVELATPVTDKGFGTLPALNSLDRLKVSSKTTFTSVGYGLQESFPTLPISSHSPLSDTALKIRMYANPHLVQINGGLVGDFSLLLSNNAATGGTCFGDSGGPNFVGDSNVVGGVTSFGLNGTCGGTGGVYRVDRADDLNWLYGTFGSLL